MLRSMTAYASASRQTPQGVLHCELRSVNHRYLELGLRLPEELRALEAQLRERISTRVSRGKLELNLRLQRSDTESALSVNQALLHQLGNLSHELNHDEHPFSGTIRTSLTELLQYPGVLQTPSLDPQALQADVLAVLDTALDDFVDTRQREGGKLAAVISERVNAIAQIVAQVRELIPLVRQHQRDKLSARLAELTPPAEPNRIEQELVLWLQKLDVDEELDRLTSHISECRRILTRPEPAGRRLDFLLQEFNREANTLGSKTVDSRTSNAAVELKVLIDQIREQVQNIE